MFETTCRDGVCQLSNPGTRWLATGWDGGFASADDAVNVTVPEGFDRTDLGAYVAERRARAGLPGNGPALLTGVELIHARGARAGSVTVVATVGLSNPATLPLDPPEGAEPGTDRDEARPDEPGTVNLLVGTARALSEGTLATLLATAVEAKAATLSGLTGFTGTTTDAVAVGCAPDGAPAEFAGSGTAVGAATRACVREAVRAGLESRYESADLPDCVADAENGTVTTQPADVFRL